MDPFYLGRRCLFAHVEKSSLHDKNWGQYVDCSHRSMYNKQLFPAHVYAHGYKIVLYLCVLLMYGSCTALTTCTKDDKLRPVDVNTPILHSWLYLWTQLNMCIAWWSTLRPAMNLTIYVLHRQDSWPFWWHQPQLPYIDVYIPTPHVYW